ncbi:hypothetical protein BB561_006974 [Smittium simulii]|uniref:6-phosphofructokinase n=1 Tax=Smittium simulii TaxID=133385 RepID=A0A2T9XYT1_9FUNG|nr:hypothetical protein BB561_006974 [Smittium simulii]
MEQPAELSRRESDSFISPKFRFSSDDTTFLYFTIVAYKQTDYESALDFYSYLGFRIIKESAHKIAHIDLGSGLSVQKEMWLHLFSKATNHTITLRIAFSEGSPSSEPSCVNTTLSFKYKCLKELQLFLKRSDYKHEFHTSKNGESCIVLKDPIGTQLYIYDELLQFTTPSSDSLETKMNNIPASLSSANSSIGFDNITTRKRIGIMTSGGDAQGMNAAVRAIVRMALFRDCECFLIYDGYNGLISGGNKIVKAKREDVSGFLTLGGTVIGTARCAEFREKSGRQIAALNIIKSGIDSLVVIGGDGSLTGADNLRAEWHSHVEDLLDAGKISKEEAVAHDNLMIVGLVGSIDNDLATTDITIGAYSALARICEAIDALQITAFSHHRAFVVEVMGRNCGWLALSAAICTGADYVFIPEDPPKGKDWESRMCLALQNSRAAGKKTSLIIVAEGASDSELNPIKADYIESILTNRLKFDTRVTILGHVQRGGSPTFKDRLVATLQGAEAVEAILRADATTPSLIIGVLNNKITAQPLKSAIKLTKELTAEIAKKNFDKAVKLRSTTFTKVLASYKEVATYHIDGRDMVPENKKLNIAIIHVGAPAGGINLATRNVVRLCINRGHTPILVYNGFPGLMRGEIEIATWMQVDLWTVEGGSKLGMNRDQPTLNMGAVAYQLQKNSINAIMLIGGFEAYTALISLSEKRNDYPAFCIPMVLIPATISNNIPGTDNSLGSDTAANFIITACDDIKLSASSNRKRVFIIEVQGGKCGYLAVMGGITGGASCVYIPEEKVTLKKLAGDVEWLKGCYKKELGQSQGRIALYNESASKYYTLDSIKNIYEGESDKLFGARTCILGHLQQGGAPSPGDRINANNFSVAAFEWIQENCWANIYDENSSQDQVVYGSLKRHRYPKVYTRNPNTVSVVGIIGSKIKFSSIDQLISNTDFVNRSHTVEWWGHIKNLIDILSGKFEYDHNNKVDYESQAIYLTEEDLRNYNFDPEAVEKLSNENES